MANVNIKTLPYSASGVTAASGSSAWGFSSSYIYLGYVPYAIAINGFSIMHHVSTGPSLDTTYNTILEFYTIYNETITTIIQFPIAWRIDTRVNLVQSIDYVLPESVFINAYTPIYCRITDSIASVLTYESIKIFYREIGYSLSRNGVKIYKSSDANNRVNIIGQIGVNDYNVLFYGQFGYYAGGRTTADTSSVNTIDRLDLKTFVTSASTQVLSLARRMMGGVSDRTTNGYFCGGVSSDSTALVTADKIAFSTEIVSANTASNLATARYVHGSVSDGSLYGYFVGGLPGPLTSTDKITFSSGVTAASTASAISEARESFMMVSDSSLYGYLSGGITGGAVRASAERITFSSGVFNANTVSNLTLARSNMSSISGVLAGYFLGGNSGAYSNVTDKLTYSNGTTAAATSANLTVARYNVAGVSDGRYNGFACGGYSSSVVATADKLVFSTDTASAATSANLTTVRMNTIAVSNGSV